MSERGDSEGIRPSRVRAAALGEANRLAQALLALLERANVEAGSCRDLLGQITREEQAALLRDHGRIESRKRFKFQSSQPLWEKRSINDIFLDESGRSAPQPAHSPQFFALGAVAFGTEEDKLDYIKRADEIKRRFFGTTDMTFHEPDMRRHFGAYYFAGAISRQGAFDKELASLIENSRFVVFGAGIRKEAFRRDFVETGIDPYLPTDAYALAITMLMERYVDYLATRANPRSSGRVTFESIGPKEDAQHQMDYAGLLLDGSQWVPGTAFRYWLETGLRFMPKSGSHPIELADMVSRELYEWVRDGCVTENGRWPLFSKKIYCRDDGLLGKFGVKVFPDSDIRGEILTHRQTNQGEIQTRR